MSTKAYLTKGWPTRLGYTIAKWSPPFLGYVITGILARLVVWIKPDFYWSSLDNYRHIYKEKSTRELHRVVYKQMFNSIRCYYELFHNLGRGKKQVNKFVPPVKISPDTLRFITEAMDTGRGLLILGCHMANFDLGGIGLSHHVPVPIQALSLPSPPPGFEFFNELRATGHGIVTPINADTLREALKRLKNGGIVLTGVDRPIGTGDEPVIFFGDEAYLPTRYIKLALLTNCLTMTTSFLYDAEKKGYWILGNPPMEMERTSHREQDVKVNVARVLKQVEAFIKMDPAQWMMFLPVWKKRESAVSPYPTKSTAQTDDVNA